MIESLIISLTLTIIIELTVSLVIGIRNKKDIVAVIAVNTLTNPIVVFTANLFYTFLGKNIFYFVCVLILEILAVWVEGYCYYKVLTYKNMKPLKLSLLNNVISFGIGLILFLI